MKVLSLILSLSLTAGQSAFAQQGSEGAKKPLAVEGIESAKDALAKQYAELADLKEQLNQAQEIEAYGWIGISVSNLAIATGIAGLTEKALKAVGKKAIVFTSTHRFAGGEGISASLELDDVLVIGGLSGLTGSGAVIAVESIYGGYLSVAIAEQMEKIAATQDLILKSEK